MTGSKDEVAKVICVGSRKSELALIQTRHVIASLQKIFPKEKFEIHTMTTMGDRVLNISLPKIGEKALFTKDLEDALHSGRVDFVVHSLKDLPTVLPPGMAIGAILEREDPRDALVLRHEHAGLRLATLPAGSVVGTSSLRRGAQLARKYPQLVVQDIRGNLNTRLAKLDAEGSKFAGIILAQAGLERMGWRERISETLAAEDILYAVGQGALAVECRAGDRRILGMLQRLCCARTQCRILTERSFLKTLGGGCSAPVAVITELRRRREGEQEAAEDAEDAEDELHITGAVWSLDGSIEVQSQLKCAVRLSAKPSKVGARRKASDSGDSSSGGSSSGSPVPAKRARLADESSSSPSGSDGSAPSRKTPSPPQVVDDTPVPQLPAGANVAELLRLHGDLLKRCPYAGTLHASNGDGDRCPLNSVVVGQDVMGECPYLSAEQKALLVADGGGAEVAGGNRSNSNSSSTAADVMGKCPISAADRERLVAATASASASASAAAAGCPFAKANAEGGAQPAAKAECPFLKQSTSKQAAEEAEAEEAEETEAQGDGVKVVEVPLYCGLFRHECYALEWFERCERLGQELAEALIANGALKVMECAQLEIRKGI